MRTIALVAALAATLTPILAGCGDDGTDAFPITDGCNPLGDNHCMTPWPSSAFEIDDAAAATGRRLAIPAGTLPTNIDQIPIDPTAWNWADGFSPAAPIVLSFAGGVSVAGLPGHADPAASLAAASPTVIIDMTTGERVLHFAEVDAPSEATPDRQALYLRPMQRLVGGHRYAVAIRPTVLGKGGAPLPRPPGFAALLDGTVTTHPRLEAMRARFPAVRSALEAAGVAVDELVLAWDFTVASDEFIWRDARVTRDAARVALAAAEQTYAIERDQVVDDGTIIRRRIDGELDAPLFLSKGGIYGIEVTLVRDGAGDPVLQGTYRIPFTAIVPACAYTAPAPVGMVVYGHGLMGKGEQAASGAIRDTAVDLCMVVVGTDMRGMSTPDGAAIARVLNEMSLAEEVMETLSQGLVNHHALTHAMKTVLARDVFVDDPDGAGPMPARSLVDPTKIFYYGLSQGHIFGTPVVAWSDDIVRGVVGVGGGNYSLMLERSTDWPTYKAIAQGAYPDPLDLSLAIGLLQMRWDKTETSGVAHVVTRGAGDVLAAKQLLVHMALGDDEVPNLSTEWQVRTMGAPVLGPTVKVPYGIAEQVGPLTGAALVVFDGGAPAPPPENVPAPSTGAHSLTRNQLATRRQMKTFYETGMIVNECTGPCVCQAGQCD